MTSYPSHIEALRQEAMCVSLEAWAIRARLPLTRGVERVGACPRCGGTDRFSVNTRKNAWNCRGCDKGGRDSISLVMHMQGIGFVPALEMIAGRKADDLKRESPAVRANREKQLAGDREKAAREQEKRDREAAKYRQWARKEGFAIWKRAQAWGRDASGMIPRYLTLRGIEVRESFVRVRNLAGIAEHPYVKKIRGKNVTLHTGPCMVAAVQMPDGRFGAAHQTWLDLSQPCGKARITLPDGGAVPSKIVRGTKKGGAIRLFTPEGATRLVVGEGIETTLSVLAAGFEPDTAYWCLVDLGNMAGRAARDRDGGIINDQPDMDDVEAFVPPEWVRQMVFLGDADAKTEAKYNKTRSDLMRGARRAMLSRPGLVAKIAMAERGKDFNDMIQTECTKGANRC